MNIEQAVKDAIDAFGSEWWHRFALKGWRIDKLKLRDGCKNVSDFAMTLMKEDDGYGYFALKPLPELFEHDVSFYGSDAYLMWESANELDLIVSNLSVLCSIDQGVSIRRKTSAALPFDIDRAIAGDVVEVLSNGTWQPALKYHGYSEILHTHKVELKNGYANVSSENLRMKYPKAAK